MHGLSSQRESKFRAVLTIGLGVLALYARPVEAQYRAKLSPGLQAELATGSTATVKVIVQAPQSEIDRLASSYGVRVLKRLDMGGVLVGSAAQVEAVAGDVNVGTLASDDVVVSTMAVTTQSTGANQLWASRGGSGHFGGLTGAGIGVAVMDSGIAQHPDVDSRVRLRVDFLNDNSGQADGYGHGTHVAGIIAGGGRGSRSSEGSEYVGMAPGAELVSLRVLGSDGTGYASDVIAAFEWAIKNKDRYKIRVVNVSLGRATVESYRDDPMALAAERAVAAGLVVVSSAGNLGKTEDGTPLVGAVVSPGYTPSALTVGALNTRGTVVRSDDAVTSYSSRGPVGNPDDESTWELKPDLVAPGNAIVAAGASGSHLWNTLSDRRVFGDAGGTYLTLSGSSMATAVVSGAVAQLLQAQPRLTPSQVKFALQYTAERLEGFGLIEQGAGSLNVPLAIALVESEDLASAPSSVQIGGQMVTGGGLAFLSRDAAASANPGDVTVLGNSIIWGGRGVGGNSIIWGGRGVGGDSIIWGGRGVGGNSIIWGGRGVGGDSIIWGGRGVGGNSIIWGGRGVGGNSIIWGGRGVGGDSIIWGGRRVGGDSIIWGGRGVGGDSIIWGGRGVGGDSIIWGGRGVGGDSIIWGGRGVGGDSIIWGGRGVGGDSIIWGGRGVGGDSIIWGGRGVGGDSIIWGGRGVGGDSIIWGGRGVGGDSIIWGGRGVGGDSIIWGGRGVGGDSIIWGGRGVGGDSIIWGGRGVGGDSIIWGGRGVGGDSIIWGGRGVGGDSIIWGGRGVGGDSIIWGGRGVGGDSIIWGGRGVGGDSIIWGGRGVGGDSIIWGGRGVGGDSIIWGGRGVGGDSIIWGGRGVGGDSIIWGGRGVGGDSIIWGGRGVGGDSIIWGGRGVGGDSIIWGGRGVGGDSIIWGGRGVGGDSIIWGGRGVGGDSIIWGGRGVGGDSIIWGGRGVGGDSIIWGGRGVGGDSIIWGGRGVGGDSIIWGGRGVGGDSIIWGGRSESVPSDHSVVH